MPLNTSGLCHLYGFAYASCFITKTKLVQMHRHSCLSSRVKVVIVNVVAIVVIDPATEYTQQNEYLILFVQGGGAKKFDLSTRRKS